MTGSEAGRVMACAASEVIQHRSEDHAHADSGHDKHRDAEVAAELGDLDSLPPKVAALLSDASGFQTEVTLAYDVETDTARVVPGVVDRQYPPGGPQEIFMRLDLLVFHEDAAAGALTATIVDHKLYRDQGDPRKHGQVMTQALAVSRCWPTQRIRVAISYLGTRHVVGPFDVDWMDLDDHADHLRQTFANIDAARQDPPAWIRPGSHCRYCPAFWDCPAQQAALAEAPERAASAPPPLDDDAEALRAMELMGQLEIMLARVKTAVQARAAARPIPLGDGRLWGQVVSDGSERLDGRAVFAAAAARYGAERAAQFVEIDTSKKRIDEALKEITAKGAKAEAMRQFMDDVRRRGGASRGKRTSFTAYTPQLAAPAEENHD